MPAGRIKNMMVRWPNPAQKHDSLIGNYKMPAGKTENMIIRWATPAQKHDS